MNNPVHFPDAALIRRFASYPLQATDNGCIVWAGPKGARGYGVFRFRGKIQIASRVSLEIKAREPLGELKACHSCDNRRCVNPAHLWAGTDQQNMQDCVSKKRTRGQKKTACVNGHAFCEENTYINVNGSRTCRVCNRERKRKSVAKLKGERS